MIVILCLVQIALCVLVLALAVQQRPARDARMRALT
jgi:hypothetical protein